MKDEPMIILFGGEKGGGGKSTWACIFAIMCELKGLRTLFVDCDPQPTSRNWMDRRRENLNALKNKNIPDLISADAENMVSSIQDAIQQDDYSFVIIDIAGKDAAETRVALTLCDIAIFPINSSINDLMTLQLIPDLIAQYAGDDFLGALILLNRVPTNVKQREREVTGATEFLQDLIDSSGINKKRRMLSVAETIISDRATYKNIANPGISPLEKTQVDGIRFDINKAAQKEAEQLWDEIITLTVQNVSEKANV